MHCAHAMNNTKSHFVSYTCFNARILETIHPTVSKKRPINAHSLAHMSSCVAQHDDSNVHQQAPQIHIKPNGIRNLAASLRVWKQARALTRLTSVPARELGRSLADRCSSRRQPLAHVWHVWHPNKMY